MVAQSGIRTVGGVPPIRYDALSSCLKRLDVLADSLPHGLNEPVSVHVPRLGCGLAGGTWERVGLIVESSLLRRDVYVYDAP